MPFFDLPRSPAKSNSCVPEWRVRQGHKKFLLLLQKMIKRNFHTSADLFWSSLGFSNPIPVLGLSAFFYFLFPGFVKNIVFFSDA